MSWRTISTAEFLAEGFNAQEREAVQNAAGGDDGLADILTSGIAQWRGLIAAAGNDLGAAGEVPDSIRPYLVSQVRWRLLVKFPKLATLQTEERQKEAERAEEIIDKLAKGSWPIEPVDDDDTTNAPGNWNSNPKIDMRTDVSGERANEDS